MKFLQALPVLPPRPSMSEVLPDCWDIYPGVKRFLPDKSSIISSCGSFYLMVSLVAAAAILGDEVTNNSILQKTWHDCWDIYPEVKRSLPDKSSIISFFTVHSIKLTMSTKWEKERCSGSYCQAVDLSQGVTRLLLENLMSKPINSPVTTVNESPAYQY